MHVIHCIWCVQMLVGAPPFKAASEYLTFQLVAARDVDLTPLTQLPDEETLLKSHDDGRAGRLLGGGNNHNQERQSGGHQRQQQQLELEQQLQQQQQQQLMSGMAQLETAAAQEEEEGLPAGAAEPGGAPPRRQRLTQRLLQLTPVQGALAADLIDRLLQLDPSARIGADEYERGQTGGLWLAGPDYVV